MEPLNESFFSAALGKEIAKHLIISAVTTVGMLGGMIAVGYVIGKVKNRTPKREAITTPE